MKAGSNVSGFFFHTISCKFLSFLGDLSFGFFKFYICYILNHVGRISSFAVVFFLFGKQEPPIWGLFMPMFFCIRKRNRWRSCDKFFHLLSKSVRIVCSSILWRIRMPLPAEKNISDPSSIFYKALILLKYLVSYRIVFSRCTVSLCGVWHGGRYLWCNWHWYPGWRTEEQCCARSVCWSFFF